MDGVLAGRVQMREVKVNKADLLKVIRENRTKHIEEFKEACDGYKEMALAKITDVMEELKGKIGRLKEGQAIALMAVNFGLQVPESHEAEYDTVIRMLEMSIDDTLLVRTDEFECYVMDRWDWKDRWSASNVGYVATSRMSKSK